MKKIAVITGGSSGIGLATAQYLTDKDFMVHSIALSECPDKRIISHVCDVTDEEGINKIFAGIFAAAKRIDILINCAGFGISGAIEHTKLEIIKKQFEVNLLGTINVCKSAIPYLRGNQPPKIINIGSVASEVPLPFQACYSASKAAILNFSTALRLELLPFNIKVTTVLPGDIATNFTASRQKITDDENYGQRLRSSVSRMEKDELGGMPPLRVAKVIYKIIKRKNPPVSTAVGCSYKFLLFLNKILPRRFATWVIGKLYG